MATPPSTAVPFPTFGDQGFIIPDETAILNGALSDINGAFGNNLNITTLNTPQGQLASSETAIIGDSFAMFLWMTQMVDPAYSTGRMQDAIGRIYFISRIPGAATVQPCSCSGLSGVNIPVGAIAQAADGSLWTCIQAGIIPAGGNVLLNFQNQTNGPIPGPPSLSIYQTIPGWDSVTPSGDAVIGRNVESPSQFEARRALSTGLNSMGPLNAIYAAIAAVPNVLDVFTTQNNTGSPVTIGGVSIAANSMYAAVLGGVSADIAAAIYSRKMPGCGMVGSTTVSVPDPNPAYHIPIPTTNISFQIPTVVPFAVSVTIFNSPQVPSTALASVQAAIISAFAGTDGGPRAKIGSTVLASRYYWPVAAIGNTFSGTTGQVIPGWSAAIVSIKLGISGTAASITGSISGTTLHVTAISSGALAATQLLQGTGLTSGTGTIITAQLTGSLGGTGTYSVSLSQIISSGSMTATAMLDDVTVNINQAPAVAAGNIYLNLS